MALYEPTHKKPRLINDPSPWPAHLTLTSIPMEQYTIEKDFIDDMMTYLGHYHQLPELQKTKLVKAGVKGEARYMIMGYAEKELNSIKKIFQILKNKFKKREKSARNLYKLKQEQTEKVSVFAGRIRKYVRGLVVKDHKFDYSCIEFMKIGALPQIQSRLYQRNLKTFAKAIKVAIEAESDKPNKIKPRIESANSVNEKAIELQQSIKELCSTIQLISQKADKTTELEREAEQTSSNSRIGMKVKGACFIRGKVGHRFMACF